MLRYHPSSAWTAATYPNLLPPSAARAARAKTVKRRPDGTASPLGPAARSAHSGHYTGTLRSHELRPDSACWSLTPAAYTAPACPGLDACKEKLRGLDPRFPNCAILGQDARRVIPFLLFLREIVGLRGGRGGNIEPRPFQTPGRRSRPRRRHRRRCPTSPAPCVFLRSGCPQWPERRKSQGSWTHKSTSASADKPLMLFCTPMVFRRQPWGSS